MSRDEKVDPVGAYVGHRGSRVQAVVNELYDEKIDIVRWNGEMALFIGEALSPAKAVKVNANEDAKSAFVVVPDNQLSLAIGKAGQNVRLAARLTGWRIDIRSEAQVARAALMAMTGPATEDTGAEDEAPLTIGGGGRAVESDDDGIVIGASPASGNGHSRSAETEGHEHEHANSVPELIGAAAEVESSGEETGVL
jgi:N utilization substance protein A